MGENLEDQPNVAFGAIGNLNFTGTGPYVAFANVTDLFGSFAPSASIPAISAWAEAVSKANDGYVNATALETIFRIQHDLVFDDFVPDAEIIVTASGGSIIVAHWALMPFSRGSVHITSAQPLDPPRIDPKYFVAEIDMTIQTAIAKFARSILYTKPMSDIIVQEITPGLSGLPLNGTDAEWATFLKRSSESMEKLESRRLTL